ncbi:MAG: c-type cytochrome, partial [Flavobacterium sp.]
MKKFVLSIVLMGMCLYGYSQNAANGKSVYTKTCIACHQPTGAGIPGAFPPLVGWAAVTGTLDVSA